MHNLISYKSIFIFFTKNLQKSGLKESCELTFKNVFSTIKKDTKKNPFSIFKKSLDLSRPFCEIKSIKVSGNSHKIPVEISINRQKILVCRWILSNSFKNSNNLTANLTEEIINTSKLISKTIKICDEFHNIADSNKIYIKFKN
uniref:ribosomal protein S7 n=1 Tax=Cryptomonas gyropyrenoidosa TaxID=233257 RepID=UPI0027AAED15|nr:ribosomal protein S7 [Cryptomonas gyropyrenoidosa]WFQ82686.1 ribosomal protein S7 [Cryptomonas gyropyrenoidosa]